MSDDAQTQDTSATTSAPPLSTQPPGNDTRGLYDAGLRFGANDPIPEWAKGKTAKEVLEIATQFQTAAMDAYRAPPQQVPQYQQYEQPAQQRAFSGPQMPPASLSYENPDEYNRQLDAYNRSTIQSAINEAASTIMPQMATTAKWMSQNDAEYRNVWGKYGPEIELEMAKNRVEPRYQTKEAWDLVASVVRGRHYRELADEIATQRIASGGFGTEGSASAQVGSAPQSDPLVAFWNSDHDWVRKAKAGDPPMTLQQVRDHIRSQQLTEAQWVSDMTKGRSFRAEAA